MISKIRSLLSFLAEEAWEKINVVNTWRELKALGQKHGARFFVVAVLWELIEDVLFPYLSWKAGHAELIPVFLVLHFEPVVYPVFFFVFRTWDRILGREAWEPDRSAQSKFWRTGLQALLYRIPATAGLWLILAAAGLPLWVLAAQTVGMTLFSVVHDRLWHDSNFGIDVETDTVRISRVLAKTVTYRVVSTLVLTGLFQGLTGRIPVEIWLYQVAMFTLHLALNLGWARTSFGIAPVVRGEARP